MRPHIAFWAICAILMLGISAVVFGRGHYLRNYSFAMWVCFTTMSQLVAFWGLMAQVPDWILVSWRFVDYIALALVAVTLIEAAFRWDSVTNPIVAKSLGVMVGLQLALRAVHNLPGPIEVWAHNLAFFGPAAWMFLELSGARIENLPAWIGGGVAIGARAFLTPGTAKARSK